MSWMDLTEQERAAVIAEHVMQHDPSHPACPFCGSEYANGFVGSTGFQGEYTCETTAYGCAGHHRTTTCRMRAAGPKRKRWWNR